MITGDQPAFAIAPIKADDRTDNQILLDESKGLTKREYFAGLAMQGFITATHSGLAATALLNSARDLNKETWDLIAKKSVDYADALLSELQNI